MPLVGKEGDGDSAFKVKFNGLEIEKNQIRTNSTSQSYAIIDPSSSYILLQPTQLQNLLTQFQKYGLPCHLNNHTEQGKNEIRCNISLTMQYFQDKE